MSLSNFEELLRHKYGTVRYSNDFLYIPCPTCDPEDKHKCKRYVRRDGQSRSKCWICDTELTVEQLLEDKYAQLILGDAPRVVRKENPMAKTLPCLKTVRLDSLPPQHPALQFLRKDHLTDFTRYTDEFGIVYCPSDGGTVVNWRPYTTSADRLIFPVKKCGELVGWQMRSIPGTVYGDREDVLRYYHCFNKGDYLYNEDNAKAVNAKAVIVVEGVKKALKFHNAVATLGKNMTANQVSLLQQWDYVTLLLDAEQGARKIAVDVSWKLKTQGMVVTDIDLGNYGYESPDDVPAEWLNSIIWQEWNLQNPQAVPVLWQ